ncbi:high mobility group box domain-containing protein [Lobosporangium transversale]|uniref:High mobility group box domain-containing protein n=1 Tax=Lobosporangium transversale TaxID=64571 RepID=A0A1Y2GTK8_9FUNG|nr:high mobility group box domain-containing protein [Lobosporangium transversale]ORZ22849.1 high mobility group box domain-containing protein [Lobosporangium transversale]|eukprot:XP_021883403.1 high mobility group box domain-containing protein [Lobosporangium transversale]
MPKVKSAKAIKSTKTVDPMMPKRPLSAYLMYCRDNRTSVQMENQGQKPSEVMKTLGHMWRNLSEKEKMGYSRKHSEELQKYIEKVNAFFAEKKSTDSSRGDGTSSARSTTTKKDAAPRPKAKAPSTSKSNERARKE